MRQPALMIAKLIAIMLSTASLTVSGEPLRIASFNVSIEATNYLSRSQIAKDPSLRVIVNQHLSSGEHPQLKNVAEIIQRTRPDVLLLNEFDFIAAPEKGIELFLKNYLNQNQNGQSSINYPYFYIAPVNTGLASPHDFDNDGKASGVGNDAYGFGYYEGQYAMVVLSRHPIQHEKVRSWQTFLWKDMPNALVPTQDTGEPWYTTEEWKEFRLSSKSHWDVPISVADNTIHLIAAHPTPPVFDGPEDRNGKRNHDEIRLISDYLSNKAYLRDDNGQRGGLASNKRFVVAGDLNSSPVEGNSIRTAIKNLLNHDRVNASCTPKSEAGQLARPDNPFASAHTAEWGARVDYVLPSNFGFTVIGCGVFWPAKDDPLHRLVASRKASSDHRLVWVDLEITQEESQSE